MRRRRLLAVFVGLAVALVLAEVALRVTGAGLYAPRIDSYAFRKLSEDPDRLYWGFDPDVISWHAWDGDPYDVLPPGERMNYDDVDAHGLRGPAPPDDGAPRLLFVGDSFTFGEGVPREETFVERVGAALSADGRTVHVRNAGIPGYGTFEEFLRLPELIESERPTAVIVVFVPNDPIHVSDAFGRDDDLLKRGGVGPWTPRIWAVARRALTAGTRTAEAAAWYLSYYTGERREAWHLARERLASMHRFAAERGVPLGVAYFPLLHHVGGPPFDVIAADVRTACAEADIPFLDLSDALARVPAETLWLHPVDHHPNPRAHALVAPAITPFAASLLEQAEHR